MNVLIDLLKRIFIKDKELYFETFVITIDFDLHKHPDVSKNSPVRFVKFTNFFKYYPSIKKLQYGGVVGKNYNDIDISSACKSYGNEILNRIKDIEIKYKRSLTIKNAIK